MNVDVVTSPFPTFSHNFPHHSSCHKLDVVMPSSPFNITYPTCIYISATNKLAPNYRGLSMAIAPHIPSTPFEGFINSVLLLYNDFNLNLSLSSI